jgi:hypothetical protein
MLLVYNRNETRYMRGEYVITGFRRRNDALLIHVRLQLHTSFPSVVASELQHTEWDGVVTSEQNMKHCWSRCAECIPVFMDLRCIRYPDSGHSASEMIHFYVQAMM